MNFVRTGIHSHDDGVIHWHPYNSRGVGKNAVLGVFLDTYDVELERRSHHVPDGARTHLAGAERSLEYIEGETKCDGEDAEVTVKAWDSFTDTDGGSRYIANMDNIHIDNDGMVFAIYFTPTTRRRSCRRGPRSCPQLGAIDTRSGPTRRPARRGYDGSRRGTVPPTSVTPADERLRLTRPPARRRLMLAVVLVGGFGTRLRPLTNDVPKPMLPVVHRPMIVQLVERLAPAGVTDVVLALGFKPEPFAGAFPDGARGDVRIHYAVEPEPLDTGGAIALRGTARRGRRHVHRRQRRHHHRSRRRQSRRRAPGVRRRCHHPPDARRRPVGVRCRRDRRRRASCNGSSRSRRRARPTSNLINAGTYVFEPSVLDLVAAGRARCRSSGSCSRSWWPTVGCRRSATDDYWIDTGRPELYLQANLDLVRWTTSSALRGDPSRCRGRPDRCDRRFGGLRRRDRRRSTPSSRGRCCCPVPVSPRRASVVDSIVAGRVAERAEVRGSRHRRGLHGARARRASSTSGCPLPPCNRSVPAVRMVG